MKLAHIAALAPLLLAGCASTGTGGLATAEKPAIRCNGPDFNATKPNGRPVLDETGMALDAERTLRAYGVKGAHQTRWWNGCIQTFVPVDGHDVMKFYDPNTYQEIGG